MFSNYQTSLVLHHARQVSRQVSLSPTSLPRHPFGTAKQEGREALREARWTQRVQDQGIPLPKTLVRYGQAPGGSPSNASKQVHVGQTDQAREDPTCHASLSGGAQGICHILFIP